MNKGAVHKLLGEKYNMLRINQEIHQLVSKINSCHTCILSRELYSVHSNIYITCGRSSNTVCGPVPSTGKPIIVIAESKETNIDIPAANGFIPFWIPNVPLCRAETHRRWVIGQCGYPFLHYSTDNYQHSACYLYTQRKILIWVPWFHILDLNEQILKLIPTMRETTSSAPKTA